MYAWTLTGKDLEKQKEDYDALLAHDKALEKAFRRDFYEKETEEFYDYLFKVFKRRAKGPSLGMYLCHKIQTRSHILCSISHCICTHQSHLGRSI